VVVVTPTELDTVPHYTVVPSQNGHALLVLHHYLYAGETVSDTAAETTPESHDSVGGALRDTGQDVLGSATVASDVIAVTKWANSVAAHAVVGDPVSPG